jgi:dolichol-phosphate mannosyltransferase
LRSGYPSIIIPARNEEQTIATTIEDLQLAFASSGVTPEIVVIVDSCDDQTERVVSEARGRWGNIRIFFTENGRHGIGRAISKGLAHYTGDCAIIMMADGSDSGQDALVYYHEIEKGYDCVFGTRFSRGGSCTDYPKAKLLLNRMANFFIRVLFNIGHDDITNAFKGYSRECVEGILPVISHHFNITVELPLKAIVRGYKYSTVPVEWRNRKAGLSKLRIQEMGSRYLFICLYLWLEKQLSGGDYVRARGRALDQAAPLAAGKELEG